LPANVPAASQLPVELNAKVLILRTSGPVLKRSTVIQIPVPNSKIMTVVATAILEWCMCLDWLKRLIVCAPLRCAHACGSKELLSFRPLTARLEAVP
jgi:hypothetical protein